MSVGLFSLPVCLDMYDVREMFSRYYVDPDIARNHVPAKWKVKIHENGKALLLVMVQDCRRMVLARLFHIGSVRLAHAWIELAGPEEVLPALPGTSRTLPTWYWYIVPHQMDRRLAVGLFKAVGVPAQHVGQITLGGDPGGTRSGAVVERHVPDMGYQWTETSVLYPAPDIITGSHRFYWQQGIRETEAHARCFTHFLGDARVELHADPESAVGRLDFGLDLTGFSSPVWFKHCHIAYRVGFFKRR